MSTLRALIDQMAEVRRDAVFLVNPDTGRARTFESLQTRASQVARNLQALGLAKGERIALLLDNGVFTIDLLLGAMYGGFVPALLDRGTGVEKLVYLVRHAGARAVFAAEDATKEIAAVCAEQTALFIQVDADSGDGWDDAEACGLLPPLCPEDTGMLAYTSGSTGPPKGVLLTQGNLLAGARTGALVHRLTERDAALCVLPLVHMNAVNMVLRTLWSGGRVVLPQRFNLAAFWGWIDRHRCTWSALVPTLIAQLNEWTDPRGDGLDLSSVRFMRSSAAPLPLASHRTFEEKFKLPLIEAMGSTEAGGLMFANPLPPALRKPGSVGLPCSCEVKLIDSTGEPVPEGATGEILVRSASIMAGYDRDPDATARAVDAEGWLHTGDLGYRDVEGYVFIIGRTKELIIKGGKNIALREIEEVLERHPAVLEAAALGIPDPFLGEDLIAFVNASADEATLRQFCEQILGPFKTPSHIHFVDALPRGPSGKVQRLKLAAPVPREDRTRAGRAETGGPEIPCASVEQVVAEIWGALLGRAPLGLMDNFFVLGGTSLSATRALARLRDRLGVDIPLHEVFDAPTVARLAAVVVRYQAAAQDMTFMAQWLAELEAEDAPSFEATDEEWQKGAPRERDAF